MMRNEQEDRLTRLRQAYEEGKLDKAAYEAAIAEAEAASGAAAQGEGATAVGERGVNVGGNVGGSIITGDNAGNIVNNVINFFQNQDQARQQHDRRAMLEMVEQFWIDGVLEKSLYQSRQIELRLEIRPEAVDNQAWQEVIQLPPETANPAPAAETIGDLFYGMSALNRSLLILGSPGSGKTTALLNLARQALAKAKADPSQPIPVVFNLASWGAKQEPIADWLVEELNNKYFIPDKLGRPWVENDELLPLLDGLDEVETTRQADCVRAINAFQHAHRMPLAVCARDNEYEPLPVRLQLQTAVSLHSLTPAQVTDYLAAFGGEWASLSQWLQQDARLQELAQTPLLLNTMLQTYQGVSMPDLESLDSREARHRYLFAAYVTRMFQHGSPQKPFPQEQTIRWLSWLAQGMERHSQAIFLIERLQPGWLSSRGQRWLHLFVSRMTISLVSGLIGGVIIGLGFTAFFETTIVEGLMRGISEGLLGCFVGGLAVVVLDGLRLESQERALAITARLGHYGRLAFKILVVGTAVYFSVWLTFSLFLGGIHWMGGSRAGWSNEGQLIGLLIGLCYSFIFGFSPQLDRQILTEDVLPVEFLGWSRSGAAIGTIYGLAAGLASGLLLWLLPKPIEPSDPLTTLFANNRILLLSVPFLTAAGAIFGGLTGRIVPTTSQPNQGIRLSAVNAAVLGGVVGVFFALAGGVIGWLMGGSMAGLTLAAYGSFFGLLAAIWYGGLDVVKHFSLRLILVGNGRIPSRLAQFLDYATERILMRRVGGGFIFIHRLLADYFGDLAARQAEPSGATGGGRDKE